MSIMQYKSNLNYHKRFDNTTFGLSPALTDRGYDDNLDYTKFVLNQTNADCFHILVCKGVASARLSEINQSLAETLLLPPPTIA